MPTRALRCVLFTSLMLFFANLSARATAAETPPGASAAAAKPPVSATPPGPTGLQELPEQKGLKYRLVGPAWGGRVARVTGVPGDPRIYYAATASGGGWKSVDGGAPWNSVFDAQPISSTGSIAIAPSVPNVVYVGSGEA